MNDLPVEARSLNDEQLQRLIERGPEGLAGKQWDDLLDEWLRRAQPTSQPVVLGNMVLAPKPEAAPSEMLAASLYEDVPWFRRSGVNSGLLLLGLVFPPAMACVCGTLLTGDIFYNKVGDDGTLKRWSGANRVVAYVALGLQLVAVFYRLVIS
jgi:hypothetical protein